MTNTDPLDGRVRESLSVLLSSTPLAPEFDELPEQPSDRRPHPALVVGLATFAAVAIAFGGLVLRESSDTSVDTGGTSEPSPAAEATATTSPIPLVDQMETVLYMFHQPGQSGRLVRLDWILDVGSSPLDRLRALFAWRPPATSESGVHQLVNAIPEQASVLSATIEPGTTLLTVDTDGLFVEQGVQALDLSRALAQVVWTATQDPAVTEVRLRSNGTPMQALTSDLRAVNRPVNRSDYPLEPGTEADSSRSEDSDSKVVPLPGSTAPGACATRMVEVAAGDKWTLSRGVGDGRPSLYEVSVDGEVVFGGCGSDLGAKAAGHMPWFSGAVGDEVLLFGEVPDGVSAVAVSGQVVDAVKHVGADTGLVVTTLSSSNTDLANVTLEAVRSDGTRSALAPTAISPGNNGFVVVFAAE